MGFADILPRALAPILALTLAAPAVAQTRAASESSDGFGVKGGVVWSTLDLTIPSFIVSAESQIGLTAGAFFGYRVAGPVHLDVEGLFTTKGAKYALDDFQNELQLTYLEVPVLARVGVLRAGGVTAFVSGGPSFAFKLKEVQKEGGDEIPVNDEVKSTDVGVAFGGGVTFGRWIADVRYTLGLVNVVDVDTGGFSEPEARNRSLAVTFGYRWR
jgi:outer membrane protein with beta-barrel domain